MKQKLNQRPRSCSLAALGLLLAFLTGLFTGCAPRQEKQVDFRLVTSFYPMYIIALNVTEGRSVQHGRTADRLSPRLSAAK